MIKVESEIPVYEIEGKDVSINPPRPVMKISSHWNRHQMVVIRSPQDPEKSITVLAADLVAAVTNATNRGSVT